MKKKKTEDPRRMTAQEFLNVEDISDGLLYSVDGHLFGYLSIRAGDNKLMSVQERIRAAERVTASLAGETEPWRLLSVPRTVDTLGMISRLIELRKGAQDEAKLQLINGEISALQGMAREVTKEPMIVMVCWTKAIRGADTQLKKRLHDLRSRLTENRVSCEIMGDREITYLCKVFADLTSYQQVGEEPQAGIPMLNGEERLWETVGDDAGGLLDLITPVGGLSFGVSRTVVGPVVGRVYGVTKYPSELDYGWCVELINTSDCVTSITYMPGSVSALGEALSQSIKRNRTEAQSESDARLRKRYERQAQDADRLIDELDAKSAAIGHVSWLVMPFTDNEAELEDVCHQVVSRYSRKRIKLKPLGNLQKEGYKQLSPYHLSQPRVEDIVRQIMPLKTLMGGSPMVVNVYRDDGGYYFGRTMDGGIISLDFLYRGQDRTNSNMVAVGAAGSGKSTTLKSIAETLYMSGVKVIIIDPEREFRDLCKNLGGTWLDAGGGTAKVNPLQIRAVPEDDEEESQEHLYQANDNAMALHIHTLDVFFKLYLPSLTDLQRALVKKALVTLYQNFQIDWGTNVATLSPEAFPLFSDFYALLQQLQKEDERYEEIAALFCDMAEGADSFLWNGATNVEVDNDFIVLDTNRLQNSSDEVKRSQYFNILTLCWDMISADRSRPVFLLCDEAHILLDPAIPQTAMYLRNMAKRVRKYEGLLAVVTQSVVDFLHDDIRLYGQAILDNATYKFLFSADGRNLQETTEVFQLTASEQNVLLAGERGKALCLLGRQHVHVDFDLPAYKLELMGRGGGR